MAMPTQTYGDLTLDAAIQLNPTDEVLQELGERVNAVRSEQDRFRTWCERADRLYYPETFTPGGADLWPEDPGLKVPGRAHLSVNTAPVYVDVPASLQSVEPIENMLATEDSDEARSAATHYERMYVAWKADQDYELLVHKANTVKALYGRVFSRIYWDRMEKKPVIEISEQPRNVWVGYRTDSYDKVEWAAYVQRVHPNQVVAEFGVYVDLINNQGTLVPNITLDNQMALPARSWLQFGESRIEVWDYWYRKPKPGKRTKGKPVKMETWNIVIAGSVVVRGPIKYPEYEGDIPCIPLFNTFIPGVPDGRPELYDMEQLIRETYERMTSGSQMIASGTAGQFWQLVGPDAPTAVPDNAKPKINKVVAPGPGNRIEAITPFIAQFQWEQYMGRLDRAKSEVSGLNDLLLGLAPAQVLSSSKAINALVANYEARLSMRRRLLYSWRKKNWTTAAKVWAYHEPVVKRVLNAGGGVLDITDPSLMPRDEMETMTRALNAMNGKLASQVTAMDWVGIDDPEMEQELIRKERTDATLFPESVQLMAQLLLALQSAGLQPPPGAVEAGQAQLSSGQNDLRTALGAATPGNTTSSQLPGDQGEAPPIPGAPPEAGGAATPFAQGPTAGNGVAQTMIQGGEAKSRILTQQKF